MTMETMTYSYEINPRPGEMGGGWRLRLLEGDEDVGGGVFPPVEGIEDADEALQAAHDEAHAEALDWMDSRSPDAHMALWPSPTL